MAFFGIGKKKEEKVPPAGATLPPTGPLPPPQIPESPKGTPVEQVLTMQKQGLSNHQIVQTLQQQGFSSQQVFDAINQASIKGGVKPAPAEQMPPIEGTPPSGGPPIAPPAPAPAPAPEGMPPPPMPLPAQAGQGIEETIEAVIEEKWKEISGTISKLNEWKDSTEVKVTKIQQAITDIKSDMDNLHKAIVAKIGEYDQNLLNVGTEIKAMEKVFSKVLPAFTENVNELSRVTRGLKTKKK